MREAPLDTMDKAWRVVATGFCFTAFGLGGLLFGAVVFPALRLIVREPQAQRVAAKALIGRTFRLFVRMMRALGVLSFEVSGLQRLHGGGKLVLANHPTLIDVVFLIAFIERADCIVKAALGRNPFTRGPVRAAGYVCNDAGSAMVDDCIASVGAGNNLIIFPEGTRTRPNEPCRLHRGAARVALHGALDIVPVRIQCSPPTLAKGAPWWHVPRRKVHFRIHVGASIAIAPYLAKDEPLPKAARRLTADLTHYFTKGDSYASA
jgi:1-acyl-sn-glycerol-3-phosphate acyltransferase